MDHFLIFAEPHLRHLLREYVQHYNSERYHHGLGGKLLTQPPSAQNDNADSDHVHRRKRLGGTLNFYHRKAA